MRTLLLERFDVEWVVASHDSRNRHARNGLPGRRFVTFSESTRIAETLVVATKRAGGAPKGAGWTRFVNLRRNPDKPMDAMVITRALLAEAREGGDKASGVAFGDVLWGELLPVRQCDLEGSPWIYGAFCQGNLVRVATRLASEGVAKVYGASRNAKSASRSPRRPPRAN